MIVINEPQLPWLRTAIILYHTGLDVKNGSHPMRRMCMHMYMCEQHGHYGAAGAVGDGA